MDFTPTPAQVEAGRLARTLLGDRCAPARLRAAEAGHERFDRPLWRELGDTGLLGLAVPEEYGGAGHGLLEACSVAVEAGRVVAPVPLAGHAAAMLALAVHGSEEQRRAWLPAAAAGGSVLTCALSEDHGFAPASPVTVAERSGGRWVLEGAKTVVPAGTVADLVLLPASTPDGVRVFLVRPGDEGVTAQTQVLNDRDTAVRLELSGAALPDDRVLPGGTRPGEVARWLAERVAVLACATQVGVLEGALELTSGYARTREQFGRPIGSFQAVSQRLADAFIDVHGARLTLWQAAWRLAEGLPARAEVATATLWAADAGHRVAHTAVHVHGGVGIDLDGEAHRYFTAAKRLELGLGGATRQALGVGRVLAAEPA